MQVTKDYIKHNIQEAARSLFLEKGYPNVSMREIAETAQVGLSNIYNYFKNKDELFLNVVLPVISAFNEILDRHTEYSMATGFTANDFRRDIVADYLDLIGRYKKEINILLFHSRGSSVQNFKEEFTDKISRKFKRDLSEQGGMGQGALTNVSDFSIHLHSVWLFTLFEEILKSDAPRADLETKINEYIEFETMGRREFA